MDMIYASRRNDGGLDGFESDDERAFHVAENRNRYSSGGEFDRVEFNSAQWSMINGARMIQVDPDELADWLARDKESE